jgi:hypothetical protein
MIGHSAWAAICSAKEHEGTVVLGFIESKHLLEMGAGCRKVSEREEYESHTPVAYRLEQWVCSLFS